MFSYCLNNPINSIDESGYFNSDDQRREQFWIKSTILRNQYATGEGNYYSYNKCDLYSETTKIYPSVKKEEAFGWYTTISAPDYDAQAAATLFLPEWISYPLAIFEACSGLFKKNNYYDPKGRSLYIEKGYTIIVYERVYIGNGYSSCENEYLVYDQERNLVFNNLVKISHLVD